MLISRGARLLKHVLNTSVNKKAIKNVPVRSSHGEFFYRDVPDAPKVDVIVAEVFGGFMWWWILWHMYHDFGHIVGEYPYPDPSKWTDEELGIPPED